MGKPYFGLGRQTFFTTWFFFHPPASGKSVPEAAYVCNSDKGGSTEGERGKEFAKPRLPPPPPSISNGGKVSSKPTVSDIPEGSDSVFEDFDDIMTQYGSQKPAADDVNEKTIMEAPQPPAPASTTNEDFDTFDDVTACERIAGAATRDSGAATSAVPTDPKTSSLKVSDHSVNVKEASTKPEATAPGSSTVSNGTTTMAGEESESQFDSQESMVLEVFKNLRIALLGFSDEEVGELTEMIEGSLGTIVTSTPTTLKGPQADYLIVPVQVCLYR